MTGNGLFRIVANPLSSSKLPESAKYETFSFADIHAKVILPFRVAGGPSAVEVPGLILINLSTHRDTYPVTACGRRGIRGYTTGHRIYAGSLGFNLFAQDSLAEVMSLYCIAAGVPEKVFYMSPDELPPLDFNIVLTSERGNVSQLVMRGMKFLNQNKSLSTNDVQLMDAYSFMAMNISILSPVGEDGLAKLVNRRGSIQNYPENFNKEQRQVGDSRYLDNSYNQYNSNITGTNVGSNGEVLINYGSNTVSEFLAAKGAPDFNA